MVTSQDLQCLPREIAVIQTEDMMDPQHNIDLDVQIGQEVAKELCPPVVRVWRSAHRRGIGVSRKDVSSASGQIAKSTLMGENCSVIVRQTGGTAVPQGDGVLHLSYLLPRTPNPATTDAYYRLLCDPLIQWFNGYGIEATTGALPGSYCDGTYNVLVEGQKLVGTAQAWRGGLAGMKSPHPGYILAHACLTVDVDLKWATTQINRFYELAEDEYRVNEATSVNLKELAKGRFGPLNAVQATLTAANDLAEFYHKYLAEAGIRVVDGQ